MSSVVISGNTSGTITLDAPAVAGTTTLTLPTTNGTIITTGSTFAGTGPAFSAYNSSATSLASGTNTQVLFATEDFDTNNNLMIQIVQLMTNTTIFENYQLPISENTFHLIRLT